MITQVMKAAEAKAFVVQTLANLRTSSLLTVFPKNRRDVCGVRRTVSSRTHSYTYDILYLVWKNKEGALKRRQVIRSVDTVSGFSLFVDSVEVDGIVTKLTYSGADYYGKVTKNTLLFNSAGELPSEQLVESLTEEEE